MAMLVMPPQFRPAKGGDGSELRWSQSLPPNVRPVANPEPDNPRAQEDHEAIKKILRQLSGKEKWESPIADSPRGDHEPQEERTEVDGGDAEAGPPPTPAPSEALTDQPHTHPETGELLSVPVNGKLRYFSQTPHKNGNIATDMAGNPVHLADENGELLRDSNGELLPVWVDHAGFECDPPEDEEPEDPGLMGRILNRFGTAGKTNDDQEPKVQAFNEDGVPITDFTVVKAGNRMSASNRKSGKKVLIGAAATAVLIGGFVFTAGIFMGSSRVPAEGAISKAEADRYQLSDFPLDPAIAFGSDYLRTCLTHGDKEQVAQRKEMLEAMASPAAKSGCGWQDGGSTQEPTAITFNGDVEEDTGFPKGRAAYLGFNVLMDGKTTAYTVPVWVGTTDGGGTAMQIVGDVGPKGASPNGVAPPRSPQRNTDSQLGGKLNDELLSSFFTAWGASDEQQLNLVLSNSATTAARTGLNGTMTRPTIESVTAFSDKGRSDGSAAEYVDGDRATLEAQVTWNVVASESTQSAGYRVHVVMEAGQWQVTDIESGLIGAGGGSNERVGASGYSDTRSDNSSSSASPTSSSNLGGVSELQSGSSDSRSGSGNSDLPAMPEPGSGDNPPPP